MVTVHVGRAPRWSGILIDFGFRRLGFPSNCAREDACALTPLVGPQRHGRISAQTTQSTQLAAEISREALEQILRVDAQLLQQPRVGLRVHLVRQFGLRLSSLVVLTP